MSFLMPKAPAAPPPPTAPPPTPQRDDVIARRNEMDRVGRRGRAATILTSDTGLPDLGATRRPTAGGG